MKSCLAYLKEGEQDINMAKSEWRIVFAAVEGKTFAVL